MNTRRQFLTLLGMSFAAGCSTSFGKPSPFRIKETTTDKTATGERRRGAIGAVVEWDDKNATVDLDELIRQVKIIARREATARQRQVAKQRASVAYRKLSSKKKAALKQKKVRHLAVDTEKNAKTSRKAKKAVMIWDTYASDVVGNNVYDVAETPPVGSIGRFETYAASYVGSGD